MLEVEDDTKSGEEGLGRVVCAVFAVCDVCGAGAPGRGSGPAGAMAVVLVRTRSGGIAASGPMVMRLRAWAASAS